MDSFHGHYGKTTATGAVSNHENCLQWVFRLTLGRLSTHHAGLLENLFSEFRLPVRSFYTIGFGGFGTDNSDYIPLSSLMV